MKIINIFSGFQNAYNDAGWQLWNGSDLIGVYHTRKAARAVAADRGRPTRAEVIALLKNTVYDTSTVRISRRGEVSAIMDANKTCNGPHTARHFLGYHHQFNFPGRQFARDAIAAGEGR